MPIVRSLSHLSDLTSAHLRRQLYTLGAAIVEEWYVLPNAASSTGTIVKCLYKSEGQNLNTTELWDAVQVRDFVDLMNSFEIESGMSEDLPIVCDRSMECTAAKDA